LRLRDAGASQGGSFLPARARAQSMVASSKCFGTSWAAARGGVPTRVASAAERAPQMAPEARGKVPPEMPKVWTSVDFNGGVGGGSSRQPKEQKGSSRQPQACPWRTRRATRSPYDAWAFWGPPPQCSLCTSAGASSARGATGCSWIEWQQPSGGRKSRPMMSMGQGKHGSTSPNPPEQWRTRRCMTYPYAFISRLLKNKWS
jgi:hypothetical protein